MAEIQKPPTQETIFDWINQINKDGENLTDWEEKFMVSITVQAHNQVKFSPRMVEAIEKIYCNRVPLRRFKK